MVAHEDRTLMLINELVCTSSFMDIGEFALCVYVQNGITGQQGNFMHMKINLINNNNPLGAQNVHEK